MDGWEGYKPVACTEIDPAVCLRPTSHGGAPHVTNPDGSIAGGTTEHLAGFIVGHDAADLPHRCEGALSVDPHFAETSPVWTMTGSLEGGDLTLSPSVLCKRDQFHGFVRDGKWVPA
jgi:hypothetical protein